MATFCESWDSNWMGCDENNLDDHVEADAFEAALEPLPSWDGVAYSASGGNPNGLSSKNHAAAAAPPRRCVRFLRQTSGIPGGRQRAREVGTPPCSVCCTK